MKSKTRSRQSPPVKASFLRGLASLETAPTVLCQTGGFGIVTHIGHATFDRFGPGWRNITVGGRLNGSQSCRNFNAYGFIHTSLVVNRVFARADHKSLKIGTCRSFIMPQATTHRLRSLFSRSLPIIFDLLIIHGVNTSVKLDNSFDICTVVRRYSCTTVHAVLLTPHAVLLAPYR